MSGNRHVGSNPTLSANLRQNARFARWLRVASQRTRALGEGCPPAPRAKRAPGKGGQLSSCGVAHKLRTAPPTSPTTRAYSSKQSVARRLPRSEACPSRQTVRLHHSKHQPSAETLRRRDIGPAIPAERAQRWKESLDRTLDTVDPRCEHRVSDGTDSVAFREILEIRCRSRVCQPALRRLLSKSAQIERPGSPSTTC